MLATTVTEYLIIVGNCGINVINYDGLLRYEKIMFLLGVKQPRLCICSSGLFPVYIHTRNDLFLPLHSYVNVCVLWTPSTSHDPYCVTHCC